VTEEERFRAQLDDISGRALALGGAVGMVLGFGAAAIVAVTGLLSRGDNGWVPPVCFAATAGCYTFLLRTLARKRKHAAFAVPLIFGLIALNTAFFVVGGVVSEHGIASYMTGPFLHAYPVLVVLSGMWLRPRLAIFAALFAGAQVLLLAWLARDGLVGIAAREPALFELGLTVSWFVKSFMVMAVGGGVAAIVTVARQLVVRVLDEERDKREVSKLFGDFVSADVRDKILRERGGLKSERRSMAILFSDLRNFTTHSEKTDPAVLVDRLNRYFERMVAAVEREGGVVDKFIGDAVMATFGGVVPLANPSSAALKAARAMRAALADLNDEWAKARLPPFDTGIGVHFGEVIEGPLGAPRRREYTVIGDVVNTASRIEGLTKEMARPILVTSAVFDALSPEERASLEDLGEAHVKGKNEAVRVYG
jgi:class 3 adenylate cyclase